MDKNLIDFSASPTSGASPGSSPYYNRTFWAAYKGMARGQLGGIVLGGLMGLGIGAVLCAGAAMLLPAMGLAFGLPAAGAVLAGSTAVGTKYYYDVMRDVGNVSGAIAAAMEVNEERATVLNIKLDTIVNTLARQGHLSKEEISQIQNQIETVYQKGEASFEKKFFQKPAVIWKVALVGALAGLALVGAIALGGHFFGEGFLHGGMLGSAGLDAASLAGLGIVGGGLAGASYGINRDYLRPVVNFTNALFEGNIKEFKRQQEMQRTIPMEASIESNVVAKNNGHGKRRPGEEIPSPIVSGGMTVLLGKDEKATMRHPDNAQEALESYQARLAAERAEQQNIPPQIH